MSVRQYVFDVDKGMLFDTVVVLCRAVREQNGVSYLSFFENIGFEPDEKLINDTSRVCQEIDVSSSGCQLFFSPQEDGNSFFRAIFNDVLTSSQNINELIYGIRNIDPDEVAIRLLSLYNVDNNFRVSFYRTLIATKIMLPDFLDGLFLSPETKWNLRNFLDDPRNCMEQLLAVLQSTYDRVKKEFKAHQSLINTYFGGLQKQFDETGDAFIASIRNEYRDYTRQNKTNMVCFLFSLFAPYDVSYDCSHQDCYIRIGYNFENITTFLNQTYKNKILIYQSFTDEIKLKILKLLSQEEKASTGTFIKELDIPLSTLSPHLNLLCEMQVITRENEGKRVYYKIHPHATFLAIQMLQHNKGEPIEKKSKKQKELAKTAVRDADGGRIE